MKRNIWISQSKLKKWLIFRIYSDKFLKHIYLDLLLGFMNLFHFLTAIIDWYW